MLPIYTHNDYVYTFDKFEEEQAKYIENFKIWQKQKYQELLNSLTNNFLDFLKTNNNNKNIYTLDINNILSKFNFDFTSCNKDSFGIHICSPINELLVNMAVKEFMSQLTQNSYNINFDKNTKILKIIL